MTRAVLVYSLLLAVVGCASQPIEKRNLEIAIADLSEWQALAPVSQEELRRYLDQAEVLRERAAEYQAWLDCDSKFNSKLPQHCHGPDAERRLDARLDRVEVTGARLAAPDLITNNQVADVDEGGIVKKYGDHLVVLRGGHLYSIKIGGAGTETLTLRDAHRVLEPGDDSTWLDELLLADGVIVLLGFNHQAEVGTLFLFRLTEAGRIEPIQTFEYESDDYFGYSNYGSRIVGDELVIMTSRSIDRDTVIGLPRWRPAGADDSRWQAMDGPTSAFLPAGIGRRLSVAGFMRCGIAALREGRFTCSLTSIITQAAQHHFVAADAAYFSVERDTVMPRPWDPAGPAGYSTWLYRVPLRTGASPSFAELRGHVGSPQQFAARGDSLFVLTDQHEVDDPKEAELILNRVDWSADERRLRHVAHEVVTLPGQSVWYEARFAPDWVWIHDQPAPNQDSEHQYRVQIIRLDGSGTAEASVAHDGYRIESFGDRLLMSTRHDGRWLMSLARYRDGVIAVHGPVERKGLEEHESRSHGFNTTILDGRRLFSLIGAAYESAGGWEPTVLQGLVYEVDEEGFHELGTLDATRFITRPVEEDYDEPDWYGNSRVFFVKERMFLLGKFGLVEGRIEASGIRETRALALDPECCR